jgi:hypothetical protein
MPVEIKELVIRTVVGKSAAEPSDDAAGAAVDAALAEGGATGATEEIVQECVRQVLRILAKDKER